MTAPAYSTDLTDLLLDFPNTTGWSALGGGASGLNAPETDYFIQGSNCISKNAWASALKGMIYNNGSGITVPTDGAVFMWINHATPNSLDTKANGGIRMIIGSSASAYNHWYVDGSDTNPFGGWTYAAVNPTVSADTNTGSPSGTLQYFGALANLPSGGPTKGAPFGIDGIRYGRGELRSEFGESANYATFLGANVYGTNVSRRWGLLSLIGGSYQMSGLFVMGTATNAVDFRDSNRTIFFRAHDRVTANFNGIEVRNASSNVQWTNISIQALGTASPGRWITTDNATIALDGCTFTDMGTFGFLSNLTATGTTWRRCGQITLAGGSILDSLVTGYTGASNTSALLWNVATDPNGKLDGTTFTKGSGTTHAIEFGTTSPLSMTLTDVTFSGYNASNNQNDSAIHVKRTTGTVTITIDGGTTPSYRSDGATVVLVAGAVTASVKAISESGAAIQNARVFLRVTAGGPLPYQASVTIANSGTTATVTHTSHGLATNDKVFIEGASHDANNGVFDITVTGTDTYTYTMGSSPGSNPTGTITSTFVVLNGLTDAGGLVSMSRVFASDQPVTGWARKSSSAPYYKTGLVTGTVDNTTGAALTALLVLDE